MLNKRLLLLGALATVTACSEAPPAPLEGTPASVANGLVGGTQASASAIVRYAGSSNWCTGTRVGYRQILTAAHCVHDRSTNGVSAGYQPNKLVEVTNDPNYAAGVNGTTHAIAKTEIHPSYTALCAEDPATCSASSSFFLKDASSASDVALITLATDLPSHIPGAAINSRPPVMGESLFKAGYGNEVGSRDSTTTTWRQKFSPATTVPSTALYRQPEGTALSLSATRTLAQTHIVTPGQPLALSQASRAAGDSGGPLYQRTADGNIVVFAVTSFGNIGSAARNPRGISYYDGAARVDASTSYLGQSVYSWLSERGVFHTTTPTPATPDARLRADIFDWVFYLETNPKLKAAGITTQAGAEAHWVSQGLPEGLIAHRNWAPSAYLSLNSDVANLYGSTNYPGAVTHYIDYGSYEGRSGRYCYDNSSLTRAQALLHPLVFNWVSYLDLNPDLRTAGITTEYAAMDHWVNLGIAEGRRASGNFHVSLYRSLYPDIDSAFPNDNEGVVDHFPRYGFCEQRFAY